MRAPAVLLLAISAASCGSGDAPEGPPGARWMRRVAFESLSAEPVERETRVVETLTPPAGIAPWTVEGAEPTLGPVDGPSGPTPIDYLSVSGASRFRVRIPGSFDPRAFNQVRVSLLLLGRSTPVAVGLARDGREVLRSTPEYVRSQPSPLEVTASFPRNAAETEPYDELVLWIGESVQASVSSVELAYRDPASLLPLPEDGEGLVYLTSEGRRGVGLVSGRPLGATIPVEESARLTFSYAIPPAFRQPGGEPYQLELRLDDGRGDPRRESIAVAGDLQGWHTADVPLDPHAGRDVRLELELNASGAAVVAVTEAVVLTARDEPPPTVLLVTSDTHRADHWSGADLGIDVVTPSLAALADRGVVFESAWSSTNITIPSHVSLMTGTHPRDTRVINNRTGIGERAETLAERFRAAGYRTWAAVSANHLSDGVSGLGQGFDRMSETREPARDADVTIPIVEDWLAEADGAPLFLWIHVFDAHGPYTPPDDFAQRYVERVQPRRDGEAVHQHDVQKALYRAEVSFLDQELGRVLEAPRVRDGIVAVTADHGESLDLHQLLFCHEGIYPDTVHVPLILSWPGAPAGERVAEPVQQIDVSHTLLALAGLDTQGFPGVDLVADRGGEPIYTISAKGQSASITADGWHLILQLTDHSYGQGEAGHPYVAGETQLFDLASDPSCTDDRVREELDRARQLRAKLVHWLDSAENVGWASVANLDEAQLAELAAMGYAGADADDGAGPWFDRAALDDEWRAVFGD